MYALQAGSDVLSVLPRRKALQLLGYIAREKPFAVPAHVVLPPLLTLIDSSDREVREAAFSLLVQLANDRDTLQELQKVHPAY